MKKQIAINELLCCLQKHVDNRVYVARQFKNANHFIEYFNEIPCNLQSLFKCVFALYLDNDTLCYDEQYFDAIDMLCDTLLNEHLNPDENDSLWDSFNLGDKLDNIELCATHPKIIVHYLRCLN
jgi:hypothetical protein